MNCEFVVAMFSMNDEEEEDLIKLNRLELLHCVALVEGCTVYVYIVRLFYKSLCK